MKGVPDRALQEALRENGIHTVDELPRLISLCWTEYRLEAGQSYTGVKLLIGLEVCADLEHVEMHGAVEDLTPLANAKKLRELWIHLAPRTSYAPLAGASSLVALSVKYGGGDLSPLAGLRSLEKLVIEYAPVKDLTPLADLPALREVTMWNLPKLDVSPGTKNRQVLLGWLARGIELHHPARDELKQEAVAAAKARGGTSLADRLRQLGEPRAAIVLERGTIDPEDGNTALHLAAVGPMFEKSGSVDRVATTRAVLDAGVVELEATNKEGLTALGVAAKQIVPNLEVVKLLLERGADANRASPEKAISTSAMLKGPNEALLELLLPRLARPWNPDVIDALCDIGAEKWIAKLLLDAGAKVDAVNDNGDTPLSEAASSPRVEKCHLLLDHGASVKTVNKQNRTVLHRLAFATSDELRFWELFDRVAKAGVDFDVKDIEGNTALDRAEDQEVKAAIMRVMKRAD